jgi:virginiamycin A acetyltransferase
MKTKIRKILWKILGIDYFTILNKLDYTLLKNDAYTTIGNRTYDNGAKVWRWTKEPIRIGNYCSIANNVNFIVDEGNHSISEITNFPLAINLFKNEKNINGIEKEKYLAKFKQKKGITIGNDVWIGMGVYLLPGIKIGNGVTIAAGSIVTKDIADYCTVAGIPARIIKNNCTIEEAKLMNQIKWWNWEELVIRERIDDFYNMEITNFIAKYIEMLYKKN